MLFLLSRFNPACVELINTNLECSLEKVFVCVRLRSNGRVRLPEVVKCRKTGDSLQSDQTGEK